MLRTIGSSGGGGGGGGGVATYAQYFLGSSKAADYPIVVPADSGKWFDNAGAGAPVTFTVPTGIAKPGTNLMYYFGFTNLIATAAGLVIALTPGDTLYMGTGSTTVGLDSPGRGANIVIFNPAANIWVATDWGSSPWVLN